MAVARRSAIELGPAMWRWSLAGHDLAARTVRQLEQILDHEIESPLGWWLLDHDAGTVLQGSRHIARPQPQAAATNVVRFDQTARLQEPAIPVLIARASTYIVVGARKY
jgi:hypothetical protein